MNWEEIVDKQSKEYADHINGVKANRDQLNADKQAILSTAKCNSEEELPDNLKNLLERNAETAEKEYGMYGSKFKEMRTAHQKELNQFFYREAKAQEINKDMSAAKEKGKEKSNGR